MRIRILVKKKLSNVCLEALFQKLPILMDARYGEKESREQRYKNNANFFFSQCSLWRRLKRRLFVLVAI